MHQNRNGFFSSVPPVVLNIIIINVLCWLAQIVFQSKGIYLADIFGLHYYKSPSFYPHQIVTYMFMHDSSSIAHLFFNMFAVYMFGRTLEMIWGGKRFLIYYIATGIGAALVNMIVVYFRIKYVEASMPPELIADVYANGADALKQMKNYIDSSAAQLNLLVNIGMVGASGAVYGILIAFGMLFPNVELIMLFFPVPIKAKYFVVIFGLMELVLGVVDRAGDNVAHFAHLGGLIVGFIIITYWKKTNKINGRYI